MAKIAAEAVALEQAVEQPTELDVPQESMSRVTTRLKEMGFHMELSTTQTETERLTAVRGAMKRAKIEHDMVALAEIANLVSVPKPPLLEQGRWSASQLEALKGADVNASRIWSQSLSRHLRPRPENETRRNWFSGAGLPSQEVQMVSRSKDRHRKTRPPGPSAVVDAGSRLLPPPKKKGADPPPRQIGSGSEAETLLGLIDRDDKAGHLHQYRSVDTRLLDAPRYSSSHASYGWYGARTHPRFRQ